MGCGDGGLSSGSDWLHRQPWLFARLTLDIHAAFSILAITPRSRNRLIQYHTGSPRHLTKRGTGSQAIIGRGCYVCQG